MAGAWLTHLYDTVTVKQQTGHEEAPPPVEGDEASVGPLGRYVFVMLPPLRPLLVQARNHLSAERLCARIREGIRSHLSKTTGRAPLLGHGLPVRAVGWPTIAQMLLRSSWFPLLGLIGTRFTGRRPKAFRPVSSGC